jgi:hypothetical protein
MAGAIQRTGATGSLSDLQALARLGRAAPVAVCTAVAAAVIGAAGIVVELEGANAVAPFERLSQIAG